MELTIEQALREGVAAHREGNLQEAERLYRAILQSQPAHPDANHNLGLIAVSVNQSASALPFFQTALKANPEIEQFWLSYIDTLVKEQQFKTAEQVLEEAKSQGLDHEKLNSLKAKIASISETGNAESSPSQQQLNELLEHYQNGRFNDAEELALSITQEFPKHPFGWKVLGALYGQSGRNQEAVNANQNAVSLSPQDAEGHCNLGNTLKELGRFDEAEASYRQAIVLAPDLAEPHRNFGAMLCDLSRFDEAEASLRQAIVLAPQYAAAYNNLGLTLKELGRFDEAVASFRQSIDLEPTVMHYFDNLLFALNYYPQMSSAELYREYEAYNEAVSSLRLRQFNHKEHEVVGSRRIRIGYSSSDFRGHVCRFWIEPIFRHHNRKRFELFAYCNNEISDEHTQRMKGYFDHWIDVFSLSDDAMAERIYGDQIDIMIDKGPNARSVQLSLNNFSKSGI